MALWRRPGAREILILYVVLSVVASVLISVSHPALPRKAAPLPFLVAVFFAWRVSRGGWISRLILVVTSGLEYFAAVLAVAKYWNPAVLGVVAICLVQFTLLVSPPIVARTRRDPAPSSADDADDAGGWALILAARRPPVWLLVCGVFLGLIVALSYGASMNFIVIPGCRPASSDACITLARGYPLPWLTADQNIPLIHTGALIKDCVQWALVSCSVLCASWLWWHPIRQN